jgi:hypothetical protein
MDLVCKRIANVPGLVEPDEPATVAAASSCMRRAGWVNPQNLIGREAAMSDSPTTPFGLPDNLKPEEVAQALEDAAAEIRRSGSHDAWLLDAIAKQKAAKRDDDLIRGLLGGT